MSVDGTAQPDKKPLTTETQAATLGTLRTIITRLAEGITAGLFFPAPDACQSCAFPEICSAHGAEWATQKLHDSSHNGLALGTVTGMTQASFSDDGDQQRLVSDFQTTFLLEAGAGTGKTQLLLNRLLALLRTGRSPLSRVAVITFTEKAAAELRTRLRAAVESALQASLPESGARGLAGGAVRA